MLNKDQQSHFDNILKDIQSNENDGNFDLSVYLITGKAGTGKSYLSATLINHFINENTKVQCTALTHKALAEIKNKIEAVGVNTDDLNGLSTVHSYFRIKPVINYKTGLEEFKADKSNSIKPKKCDVLFIDEVSMLSKELWNIILKQQYLYKHIILIGDEYQIPSVNSDEKFNLFQDRNIRKYKLTQIVRQAEGNPIIELASEIVDKIEAKDFNDKSFCLRRAYEYSKECEDIVFTNSTKDFIKLYFDFVNNTGTEYYSSKFSQAIITAFTNNTVNNYNNIAKCIFRKIQMSELNYIDVGDVLVLQEPAFDPFLPDEIILNNNTEFLVKDLEEDVYEGIPVYIVHNENVFIRVVKPESYYLYNEKLEKLSRDAQINGKLWRTYYDFKKRFCDVKQAFACTTHKAQGSTYERSYIDALDLPWSSDTNLAFRLFYVGLTRASKRCIVKG